MRRDLILAIALKGAGGLGWLLVVALLSQRLAPEALGRVLYALALVPLFGGMASAGWSQALLRRGPTLFRRGERGPLLRLLAGGLAGAAICALLAALALHLLRESGRFPLLPAPRYLFLAVFLLTAGTLIGAQLRAAGHVVLPLLAGGALRVLPVLAVALAPGALREERVLAAFLLALALTALLQGAVLIRRLARMKPTGCPGPAAAAPARPVSHWAGGVAAMLFQNLDLLVLGTLLQPTEAAAYLIARRLAGVLTLAADGCRAVLAPRYAGSFDGGISAFQVLARDSGRLLLAGGLPLAALVLLTGALALKDQRLLAPLLLAQTSPFLFGLTGVMMAMSDLQALRLRILLCLIPVAASLMALAALAGPQALALAAALAHLGYGAISARALWRARGVCPPVLAVIEWSQNTKSSCEKSSGRIGLASLLSMRSRSAPKRISAP